MDLVGMVGDNLQLAARSSVFSLRVDHPFGSIDPGRRRRPHTDEDR